MVVKKECRGSKKNSVLLFLGFFEMASLMTVI